MTIVLSQTDRQHLKTFISRKPRPTSRQKAQALLDLAAGQPIEHVAKRVGISAEDLTALVDQFTEEGLKGVGLSRARTSKSNRSRARSEAGIEKTAGVCGGAARIAGTRIPVWQLVEARNMGVSEAQLLIDFPRLRAVDLVEAWAYAEAHPAEIDAEVRANEAV